VTLLILRAELAVFQVSPDFDAADPTPVVPQALVELITNVTRTGPDNSGTRLDGAAAYH
jgi:hypothetical protein